MSISGFFPNPAEAAAVALNGGHQFGIILRDAAKVQTVTDDRKADTLTRNFIPAFLIPLIMEGSFRTVDHFYTMPMLADTLKLKELGYDKMPETLRRRMVSRLVKPDSAFIVPRVLENIEIPKVQGEERSKLQALTQHLQKMLCPTDYLEQLVKEQQLTPDDLGKIKTGSTYLIEKMKVDELFKKGITSYQDHPELTAKLEKELKRLGKQQWNQHPPELQQKLLSHVRMCVDSKFTQGMVKRIQKTGAWQNLLLSSLTSFIFYGLTVNLLEVKVVRPWQKRLVAERGTSNELVAPCYLATIPWILTVFGGLGEKAPQFLKKMNHLNRFLAVSAIAFGSFALTAGSLIKYKLSGPPPKSSKQAHPPSQPTPQNSGTSSQHPAQAHPTAFGIASFNKPAPHPYTNTQPFSQPTTQANFFQTNPTFPTPFDSSPPMPLHTQSTNTLQPQQWH